MVLVTAALCLAANIYHEARGEPILGQYAVAAVTMNRAEQDKDKVCQVVLARKQFSWTTKLVKGTEVTKRGLPTDSLAWSRAMAIARVMLSNRRFDVTNGARFYHADYVAPKWRLSMVKTTTIGHHFFYRH